MSAGDGSTGVGSPVRLPDRLARLDPAAARELLVRATVGDRYGLALFLAGLVFFGLTWRVGVFINDNYTVANALVAVADGHLWIGEAAYGPGLNTPGMHLVDGRAYGRNYGQVVLALPFLWTIEAVGAVADLRVALVGAWSLLVLWLAVVVGRLLDRERAFAVGGSVLAVGLFAGNIAVAAPLDPRWTAWLALQASTMVFAALCGVALYRLLARLHGRSVGLAAGAAVVLASPVAFWASLPKRHVLTTLLALCALYCLFRARDDGSLRFRALAYVPVGLTAWVHAPEGLVLLVALGSVDLLTAEANDPRALAAVGAAFGLSLLPFLVTNALVSGDPFAAPRLLPNYTPDAASLGSGGSGGTGSAGSGGGAGGASGAGQLLAAAVRSVLDKAVVFAALVERGAIVVLSRPGRIVETYLRSGYIAGETARDAGESINLTVLESLPLAGALAAAPVVALRRLRAGVESSPVQAADAFAVAYVILLAVVYQTRLPLHAQVTVRYLLPLFPLLLYGVARLPAVRRVVRERRSLLVWSYAATVLLGTQVLLAWLHLTGAALGEAVQAHGLLGFWLGLLLGGWALAATVAGDGDAGRPPGDDTRIRRVSRAVADERVGAVLLGVAAGAGTAFLLLAGIDYFATFGDFALPAAEALADRLR